ncbi:MAG: hypothetical protein ACTTKB_04565 [Treponema sp.]
MNYLSVCSGIEAASVASVEQCPDSLRYKAIGNSMAVPVMRWIGERIRKTEG